MQLTTDSFSLVEYLSVFTAFIYGYVATRFLSGWGAMINFRHAVKFSKEHLFWTFLTFGLLIDVWWGSWVKNNFIAHNLLLYYLSILPVLIFYLISVILFPPISEDQFWDLKQYFNRVRKRHYLLFIAIFLSFEVGQIFFGRKLIEDRYFNLTAISFAVAGYALSRPIIQYIILALGYGMLILHISYLPPFIEKFKTIEEFSFTEYLTIFIAFIYGSITSRFFTGWGNIISKSDRIKFSYEHFAWTLLAFGMLLDLWTGSWKREMYISLNIQNFILSLIVPIGFYGLTEVLFPSVRGDDKHDLRIFFALHKKNIYLLFGGVVFSNAITANLMDRELLHIENLFSLLALALAATAYYTRSKWVERTVLALGILTFIANTFLEPPIQ